MREHRLSQAGTVSKRLHKSTWFLALQDSSDLFYLVLEDTKGTTLWNFVRIYGGLRKNSPRRVHVAECNKQATFVGVVGLLLTKLGDVDGVKCCQQ